MVEPYAKFTRGTKKSDGDVDDDAYENEEDVRFDRIPNA